MYTEKFWKDINLSPDWTPLVNKNGTINSLMTPSTAQHYLLPKLMNFSCLSRRGFIRLTYVTNTDGCRTRWNFK